MEAVIRPAAVLGVAEATEVIRTLERLDVSKGGVWSATPGMWQRYTRPWDGAAGMRGTSELAGSIAVIYDEPRRNEITIYRVNVTPAGLAAGWNVERLCDDALTWVGLTLGTCPRADIKPPPKADPFHLPRQRQPEDGRTLSAWLTSSS
jgi:hypothetical protein